MIQRVYEGAAKSKMITDLVVATDDLRIHDHVLAFGGKSMMTSEEHSSGTDRCGEVAEKFDKADIVINIQGDEPLVQYQQIDQLLKAFERETVQIASLGISSTDHEEYTNTNRIKMVLNHLGEAMYFSRSPIPSLNNASEALKKDFSFVRHIGLYAYRKDVLLKLCSLEKTKLEAQESLEQLRWMYHGYRIQIVETDIETPNIDSPADLEEVLKHL